MRWDIFCRVIDNFGDIGVCWRLAADLGARGEQVRLWVDDPSALAWMAPSGAAGVSVEPWTATMPVADPGDVVVEAFGCDPPPAFVTRMAAKPKPPLWINLEYLSAEAYVERCHGLPSPQSSGPGRGLTKWFFYPGFGERTGGLLREPGLAAARATFDAAAWLAARNATRHAGERVVSLFAYADAPLAPLLDRLADQPTLLLVAAGAAQAPCRALFDAQQRRGLVRLHNLPWLSQSDYDRLLWSADLNFVRGEDSLVRALWAQKPFVWQIYAQSDNAHAIKLEAFLQRFLDGAAAASATPLRALWKAWNQLGPWPDALPEPTQWRMLCQQRASALSAQSDLTTQLRGFVAERR